MRRRQPRGLRTNARLCRHLRGGRGGAGVGCEQARGRHGMEEIRGNTAELDKPAGFVLSGVRSEDKRGGLRRSRGRWS